MAAATNYWLNWRALVCGIWLSLSLVAALGLIWNYEGSDGERSNNQGTQERRPGTVYADESWMPCLKKIHPAWLLGLRLVVFFLLLTLLIIGTARAGGVIFYYYTVMLAEKLNMSYDEAERWIVNLIRNAKLDAKIDSKSGMIVMEPNHLNAYEQIIENTKQLSMRTYMLAKNVLESIPSTQAAW